MTLNLRSRLNLIIILAMLLTVGLGGLFEIRHARRSVRVEVGSTVHLALQLIEAGLARHLESGEPIEHWLAQVRRLDRTRHLRVEITGTGSARLDPPAARRADKIRAPAWFAWAVAPPALVTEKQITRRDGGRTTIRIEADTDDEVAEAWGEFRGFLGFVLLLAAAIYLLVHFTIGQAIRSIDSILSGLEEIDRGDYGKRLPDFPLPEFTRISRAFNHMASSLEKARDEKRVLAQQSLDLLEEERRYLAQELHDELGQSLTAIKLMAASLRKPDAGNREAPDQIIGLTDRLFGVIRGMMRRLRPVILDELGLCASLEDLVDNWRTRHPDMRLDFECAEMLDQGVGEIRIHIYRIVQECLTNVDRHAGARRVRVLLGLVQAGDGTTRAMRLQVSDDGEGFDPNQPRGGLGLLGMRERVAGLGGSFELRTAPGAGVSIEVLVPLGESPR